MNFFLQHLHGPGIFQSLELQQGRTQCVRRNQTKWLCRIYYKLLCYTFFSTFLELILRIRDPIKAENIAVITKADRT